MKHTIYMYINIITSEKYVGRTVQNVNMRSQAHLSLALSGNGFDFHDALREYGEESFQLEVLENELTDEEAQIRERFWIEYHDSCMSGYNMNQGGPGGLFSEKSKNKFTKLVCTLDENGSSISKRAYIKRNNTLYKKDKNFLKTIGRKSSITQRKNKWNETFGFNKTNILLFDEMGVLVDTFIYKNRDDNIFGCPSRMIEFCLRTNKPMYTGNPPRDENKRKFIGWFACYEDDAWADINTVFLDVSIKEKYRTFYTIYDQLGNKVMEVENTHLKGMCLDKGMPYSQIQYSYRNNGIKIKKGDHAGWSCTKEKVKV